MSNDLSKVRRRAAKKVKSVQGELADAFFHSTQKFPRWRMLAEQENSHAQFVSREFGALVDYLVKYLETGDSAYISLFAGERIKAFYDPDLPFQERRVLVEDVCKFELSRVEACLSLVCSKDELDEVAAALNYAHCQVGAPSTAPKKILLIGDCLYLDVVAFINGPLASLGVACDFDFVASKTVPDITQQLHGLKGKKFDLIFFSPFSYELFSSHVMLMHWRNGFVARRQIEAWALELARQVEGVLSALVALFEAPIYVHDYSGLLRESGSVRRFLKLAITKRNRLVAQRLCNQLVQDSVDRVNKSSFGQVAILNESCIVDAAGLYRAGAYFYKTELQHPSMLGYLLANTYVDIIYAMAFLAGRKLVVCDLDNTLWDGVIGEGRVAHFQDRQALLKRLRGKGVVLAILSKNDPKNVQWTGGALSSDDFVYQSISWDPKVVGMKKIERALNIKHKDFIFIDDREDEREMMRTAFPATLVLDATDVAVWRRLERWEASLPADHEMDRTLMYRQRGERIAFLGDDEGSASVDESLYGALQLAAHVAEPSKADLKRVAELINRTNQFNLEGSRTSLQEVTRWNQSSDVVILTAKTKDRFGDMGLTCVAVLDLSEGRARIACFVLSCRVFGYGIERVVLNRLRTLAAARGIHKIYGRYLATQQNAPCKQFLPDNNFVADSEGGWVCDLTDSAPVNPTWLAVTYG